MNARQCRTLALLCGAVLLLTASVAAAAPLTPPEHLGKSIYFDKSLSSPPGQACADCHAQAAGWVGPVPGINKAGAVYPGAVHQRTGNRKPPTASYATLAPNFFFDGELFVGGNFWDGRATGWVLGNPAADQAMGPFLNPVEQNNPDKWAVVSAICDSTYGDLFRSEFDLANPALAGGACDFANVDSAYGFAALMVAEYENSPEVNQFSSRYDAYLAGDDSALTAQEIRGLDIFENQGQCNLCHPSAPGPNGEPPLFTDFTYDNLGVPKNPDNPFYTMDTVYLDDGSPINPEGADWIDPGLAGFLETLTRNDFVDVLGFPETITDQEIQALVDASYGKHKVPTLRNVDLRPGGGFVKAYTHNGVFKSLKEVVHFYNTRDVLPDCPSDFTGTIGVTCWPVPEIDVNVNTAELGALGLTDAQEDDLVAFLKALSDTGKVLPPQARGRR